MYVSYIAQPAGIPVQQVSAGQLGTLGNVGLDAGDFSDLITNTASTIAQGVSARIASGGSGNGGATPRAAGSSAQGKSGGSTLSTPILVAGGVAGVALITAMMRR